MGFLPNYDNPGPERELPRETGIFRLWETLSRDFWDLFRAGFLALLGCAPFLLGVAYSLSAHVLIYAPAAGLLGGAIAGPELCGLADTVLRGLRDEPGFWWHTYRRAWRQNAGACLLPGAVGGCLLSTQVFLLFHAGALGLNMVAGTGLAAGVLLALAVSLYLWPQLIFNLLCAPCFAAMGAIKREMNNVKWTLGAIGYMCGFAYVVSLIVFQLGGLVTGEAAFGIGTVTALILLAGILYLLFRKGYQGEENTRRLTSVAAAVQ